MEFDAVADGLYGLRPDAFAAARDEQVRHARAGKQADLARELAKLRRPTLSAWLINLLWRDQPQVLEQWLELGQAMAQAQAEASAPDLHRLMDQRRQLEAALIQRARALAEAAGASVTPAMEREAQETLAAALADPEVAAQIRGGRLVKPAAYAGFGSVMSAAAPTPARPRTASPQPSPPTRLDDAAAERRARERHQALAAEVAQARAALDAAAAELAERSRLAESAHQQRQELDERVDKLRAELSEQQAQAVAARGAAEQADQQRTRAEQALTAAAGALARAEQALAAHP